MAKYTPASTSPAKNNNTNAINARLGPEEVSLFPEAIYYVRR